ncbi:MAG: hypothetical protein RL139_1051 [Gemmatimonadota bacterium]|jgi:DinB superfamily
MPLFQDPRLPIIEAELARVASAYAEVLDALPPERQDAAPEGRWSPVQIVAHISKVQYWVTKVLGEAEAALPPMSTVPPGPAPSRVLSLLDRFPVLDRSRTVSAPAGSQAPRGLVLAEERRRWVDGRAALTSTLARLGPRLSGVRADHPAFGSLDGWQWALFVARHEERHLAQLREVVAETV